jgi:hypothetical protein
MKRLMAAALILSAIGVLGVWLGLPVYAENQFRQSLDAWAASRPGDRAGYAVAKLDFWAGTATIGSLTEVIEVDAAGEPVLLAVTLSGIVIRDYDFSAAERAVAGQAEVGDRIAGRIGWAAIQIDNASGTFSAKGGQGFVEDFAASRIDPLKPLDARGVRFQKFVQSPFDVTTTGDGGQVTGRFGASSVMGYDDRGFRKLTIGETRATYSNGEAGDLNMGWEGISASGLIRGEPTELTSFEQLGFYIDFSLPTGAAGAEASVRLGGNPVKGRLGWDTYRVADVRFDEGVFGVYRSAIQMISRQDEGPDEAEVAALAERAVVMLERAQSLRTGASRVLVENLLFEAEGIQSLSVARMESSDIEGLRFGKMEAIDQKQVDALGNSSVLERSALVGMDLSGLPIYLRKILGNPVTAESLQRAEAFYRDNTVAAAIPELDFGTWESIGQTVMTKDGQTISIDRLALDRWKSSAGGDVSLALSFEGMAMDLTGLPGGDPNARMGLAMLESQGIDQLKMDMIVDLDFSPARGELNLRRFLFGLDGVADLDLMAEIGGIDVESMRDMPAETRASALMAGVIKRTEVNLIDHGGREIAFALMGGESGATPEDMAQALSLQASQMIAALGTLRAAALGDAFGEFILLGGRITLKAAAGEPKPLVQLMITAQADGPAAVLELLKVEAERHPVE